MIKPVSFLILVSLVGFLAPSSVYAQQKKIPSSASVPAPGSFVAVRNELRDKVANGEVPSFAVSVIKDGKVVWEEGLGWADIEKGTGAKPDTRYGVASISKSITATGIAVFESRKVIETDSRVSALLGKNWLADKEASKITVCQLLGHTSGIPHLYNYEFADTPGSLFDRESALGNHGFVASTPGTKYVYTNLGYSVLAAIIEKIGRGSFDEVMSRELFDPLGMDRTSLSGWMGDEDAARGYSGEGTPFQYRFRLAPDGGAGFLSTVQDLAAYSNFHLGEGVPKGLERVPITVSLHKENKKSDLIYDRGWGIIYTQDLTFLISDGQMAGSSSAIVLVPEERLAIAVLCNKTGCPSLEAAISIAGAAVEGLGEKFSAALEAAVASLSAEGTIPHREYSGNVIRDGKEIPVRIAFRDGKPTLVLNGRSFEMRNNGWDRGALELKASTGLDGAGSDSKSLSFLLWPDGDRLFGTVMEELYDDRPRTGLPYEISLSGATVGRERSGSSYEVL